MIVVATLFVCDVFAGQGLQIDKAFCGAEGSWRDVTGFLQSHIESNTLSVEISQPFEEIGGDPAFGKVKQLLIDYRFGGKPFQLLLEEQFPTAFTITLPSTDAAPPGAGPRASEMMAKISAQAIVEKGAQLADDVVVGPFSYIGPRVRIGAGCIVENNVSVLGATSLGRNNHVFPLCVIGAGADADPSGACVIGDANAIREHVTICCGKKEPTRIGRDNLIMIDSHVGAGAVVGDHCIFANCTHVSAGGKVEDYVRTSAFTLVEPGAKVGAYTFVLGFAGIDRDAPPFAIVQGFPFRVRGVNAQNLRRCGFEQEDIEALKQAFHEIFDGESLHPDEEAIAKLARSPKANPHVLKLLETLRRPRGGKRR